MRAVCKMARVFGFFPAGEESGAPAIRADRISRKTDP